ncbi:MAG: DUF1003 domain-containing protein [Desulfovibrionaceae bacterium]
MRTTGSAPARTGTCGVCGKTVNADVAVALENLAPGVQEIARAERPGLGPEALICPADLRRFRSHYIAGLLETESGELGEMERMVLRSMEERDLLSVNLHEAGEEDDRTRGERWADRLASFGGSWRFIIIFSTVLAVWIAINVSQLLVRPFDPFPFILLNLVLSCLAAVQAPVIMMSQNRQEAKDRQRAENDYLINLKAELEVRRLGEKMDHLILRQWRRLMEIQGVQVRLLQEALDALGEPELGDEASDADVACPAAGGETPIAGDAEAAGAGKDPEGPDRAD